MFTIAVNGSYPNVPDPPRPPLLQRAIEDFRNGRITDKELARAKDRATVDVVAEMVAAGVEVVSDGQIRWTGGLFHVCSGLGGFAEMDYSSIESSDNGNPKTRAVEKIRWIRPLLLDDYNFIAERSPVDVRPVLPGPFSLARLCDPGVYGDDIRAFTNDLASALKREILGMEGKAKYILLDEPLLTARKHEIGEFIEAANLLCDNVEINVTLATSGGDILGIEDELKALPFGGFALDMLDGPSNETILTDGKEWGERIIQLGLVHASDTYVERPHDIARMLVKMAQYHDPGLIWVAPTGGMNMLSRDIAYAKLRSLYVGAQRARNELTRQESG